MGSAAPSGQALPDATAARLGTQFGHDFAAVRVHVDDEAARSLRARAVTVGKHIFFAPGHYAPETSQGRRLLAHELAHVVQQAQPSLARHRGPESGPAETEAEAAAQRVVAGGRPEVTLTHAGGPQRQADAGPPAPTAPALPTADVLAARIANCIGVWETNRGKDVPAPTESSLDTVAGVKASMATIEQATMPYALDAFHRFASLRKLASPELTTKEIDEAIARVKAVVTLLSSVKNASNAGTNADDYIKNEQKTITPSGLSDDNVRTMFAAVTLKATIDTKHGELGPKKTAKDAAKEIPVADRLGLGIGSLTAYVRKPAIWGENRAAWQRLAVQNMPGDVGGRINTVAISSSGTALATPVIRARVETELAKTPQPSEEALVKAVGKQNNPGEAKYGDNIYATYKRLYLP